MHTKKTALLTVSKCATVEREISVHLWKCWRRSALYDAGCIFFFFFCQQVCKSLCYHDNESGFWHFQLALPNVNGYLLAMPSASFTQKRLPIIAYWERKRAAKEVVLGVVWPWGRLFSILLRERDGCFQSQSEQEREREMMCSTEATHGGCRRGSHLKQTWQLDAGETLPFDTHGSTSVYSLVYLSGQDDS